MVGGGAAGFFAAVNAARLNPALAITLFEAGQRPLQKVAISGGGRCNVTHACYDAARLVEFYPRGQKTLRSLFARFGPADTVGWFESRGLKLKTEPDGRLFPASDRSADVIAVLLEEARRYGVTVRTGSRIEAVRAEGGMFWVRGAGKTEEAFDRVVLATGYSPPGWQLAQRLGHGLIPPVPSLFPFTVKAPILAGLQGISLPEVKGRLKVGPEKLEAQGAMLITHTGLSGPLIYRLSAWGARPLAENRYQAQLQLDLLPALPEEALRARLQQLFGGEAARKKIANSRLEPIPHRLWLALLGAAGANPEARGETLGKKPMNRLIEQLKRLDLPVTGKSPSKEEFVSCGGVPLNEVNFQTMESKKVPGLYLAGEILDIDGLTGGFNFQSCWSQGWVLAEALAGPAG